MGMGSGSGTGMGPESIGQLFSFERWGSRSRRQASRSGGSPQFGTSRGQRTSRSGGRVPVWNIPGWVGVSFWGSCASFGRPEASVRLVLGGQLQFGTTTMVILCQKTNQILKFLFLTISSRSIRRAYQLKLNTMPVICKFAACCAQIGHDRQPKKSVLA